MAPYFTAPFPVPFGSALCRHQDEELFIEKLESIFLVSVTAVIVKHGFGLISVTGETTRFRHEPKPKLSLLAIR